MNEEFDEPEGDVLDSVFDARDVGPVIDDDYDDEVEDADEDTADEDDDYEDATAEEIDFVVALYREDGAPVAVEMAYALANDLDDLIIMLRRLPGDAGAIGLVSIEGEFFVIVRVRGRNVQVLLSDAVAANDWPIARDVVDFLGIDIPDEDDDPEPVGDLGLLSDAGVTDFDMETIIGDYDDESDEMIRRIVADLKFTTEFDRAVK
ncbi:MAG: tRNA adenosine deaminase-associated protein [Propionibacteriaceae bacterium]|jgi:putative tRNA adenosine deaminase-associated protein|nr:tRNA adenosine deaminase-associated protein [Propionibacteriaceae bacterium]